MTDPGAAVASPILDAVVRDVGALPGGVLVVASADSIHPAAVLALAAIEPGAGEPARRLSIEEVVGAADRDSAAAALRRGVRGLVDGEPRTGFVDDVACGFAQDVAVEAAAASECGSPLRLAMSTIPGLALLARAASASPPDVRFAVAPDVLVSAIPAPAPAWLLAGLAPLLARRVLTRPATSAA